MTDGSHVLTAVARDDVGNTATSSDVGVNVSNPFSDPSLSCSNPPPATIWCDDFEDSISLTTKYFDYNDDGGEFVPIPGVGTNGSVGLRGRWDTGDVNAGYIRRSFGRNPAGSQSHSTINFDEIYWRIDVRTQPGWVDGGTTHKLSRATTFATSNWAQGMMAHVWTGVGSTIDFLVIDPATGIGQNGNLASTGWNDFPNLRWFGARAGTTPLFSSANADQWFCVEAHARLNTPGVVDGVLEFWINGNLEASRNDLDWHSTWNEDPNNFGINVVSFENWANSGSPATQERFLDNLVVSTQRIGCGDIR